MSSEKVSFNMSVVDLGKIQMLVEKGVYTNRTDFITKAIINELNKNEDVIMQTKAQKAWAIGIQYYSREDLEKLLLKGTKINIYTLGMLVLEDSIDLNLAMSVIESIKVYGKYKGPGDIKGHFQI